MQAIDELGLITYDQGVSNIQQSIFAIQEDILKRKFPKLFDSSTGECTKVTVRLRLKPDVHPVHMNRRPIALALEDPINAELDRLINNRIITPVDTSEIQ